MEGSLLGAVAAAGLFLLFQCCGAAAAWAALPGESGGVRLLLGSVCGTVMLQWFPVPFAFLLGFTLPAHGCAAALALLCAGLCLRAGRRKGLPTLRLTQALLAFRRRKGLWLRWGCGSSPAGWSAAPSAGRRGRCTAARPPTGT